MVREWASKRNGSHLSLSDCCLESAAKVVGVVGVAAAKQATKQNPQTTLANRARELTKSHDIETARGTAPDDCQLITMRSFAAKARPSGQRTTKLRQQPVFSSSSFPSMAFLVVLVVKSFLLSTLNQSSCLASGSSLAAQPEQPAQQEINQFVDPACKWTKEDAPTEAEKLLFVLKCDFQPLFDSFENLMPALEPNGPRKLQSLADIDQMTGVERSEESDKIRLDIVNFNSVIDRFYKEAMAAINKKEFCTYPTINRFKQLRSFTLMGSRLLKDMYDLIAIEYHTVCLKEAIEKSPKIPQIVKEVVDIYIDGKDSSLLPDLNRPAGFNDEKKDEFKFDVAKAVERNGKLEDVVGLIMDFSLSSKASDQVRNFKQSCKQFLVEIEERWQSMEMMSELLSTEVNNIQSLNNFVLRALIPTKYADVCSQLSVAN